MSPFLRIITRSIIRNNGYIFTYYRPGQLGDESCTAHSTGRRSTSGRTGNSRGTTRSAAGSATRRVIQRRLPPRARINVSRTRTRSTAVRAGAAGDRRRLRASNTGCFMCTRTTMVGSRCVTLTQDSDRAGRTTVTRASIC